MNSHDNEKLIECRAEHDNQWQSSICYTQRGNSVMSIVDGEADKNTEKISEIPITGFRDFVTGPELMRETIERGLCFVEPPPTVLSAVDGEVDISTVGIAHGIPTRMQRLGGCSEKERSQPVRALISGRSDFREASLMVTNSSRYAVDGHIGVQMVA
ncbi:hypothetical protein BDR04DRAFT_1112266 [Suillus decipiens]|nr:hypothetical protein BDR04DRAFT_1112266 [Suillus decipiens]